MATQPNFTDSFLVMIDLPVCAECGEAIARDSRDCLRGCKAPALRWDEGLETEVTFYAHITEGHAGKYYGRPEDCYEAEGSEVEVLSVELLGEEVPVDFIGTDRHLEVLAEAFTKYHNSLAGDAAADWADC